jgi:GNAT superfamily N-acetyltransferase
MLRYKNYQLPMTNYSSPLPTIRPALPRDKADVAEFTKTIWDGHDYVGEIFPRWLEDPHGQLLAAEYAGKCVGCATVTLIAPNEWWLEGFRVDPNFQDQRIGSLIDAAANEWWDEHGDGTLRLLTNSKRVKVHRLSENRGFEKMGEVLYFEAEPLAESTDAFAALKSDEVDEAIAFCQRVAPNQLLGVGWKFAAPNPVSLRAAADEGLAFWWRGRDGVLSAWEDDDERGNRLTVGLEACAGESRVDMLADFRRLASARGMVAAGWMNVVNEAVVQNLEAAGYKRAWEDAGFLYERKRS